MTGCGFCDCSHTKRKECTRLAYAECAGQLLCELPASQTVASYGRLWQAVTAVACGPAAGQLLPAMCDSPKQNWSKRTSQAQQGCGLSYYNNKITAARPVTNLSHMCVRAGRGQGSSTPACCRSVRAAADGPGRAGRPPCRFRPQFRCQEFLPAHPLAKQHPKARRIRPSPQTGARGP